MPEMYNMLYTVAFFLLSERDFSSSPDLSFQTKYKNLVLKTDPFFRVPITFLFDEDPRNRAHY